MKERSAFKVNGFLGILLILLLFLAAGWSFFEMHFVWGIILVVVASVLCSGISIVQPNEAKVITFFGRYVG